MDWSDPEGIGIALYEAHGGTDPLSVRFTDLRDMIANLNTFTGDITTCNEKKLEAVQMAWWEEYQDNQ